MDNFRWTEARMKSVAQQLARETRAAVSARRGKPVIEAPYQRAGQPCFYGKRHVIGKMPDGTPIVASTLPQQSRAQGPKIQSTQLEPGVVVQCESYAQFEAECRRRGKEPK